MNWYVEPTPFHGQPLELRRVLNVANCAAIAYASSGNWEARPWPALRYDDFVQELRRITIDPEVMGGKPCIRGMRVTVGMIVEAVAAGRTVQDLLADFPYLEEQDIREALSYAASLAQGREVRLAS